MLVLMSADNFMNIGSIEISKYVWGHFVCTIPIENHILVTFLKKTPPI